QPEFLLRQNTSEDIGGSDYRLQFRVIHPIKVRSEYDCIRFLQPDLPSNTLCGAAEVAGNHNNADPGTITLLDSRRHRGTNGISQAHEAHKFEIKMARIARQVIAGKRRLGNAKHSKA